MMVLTMLMFILKSAYVSVALVAGPRQVDPTTCHSRVTRCASVPRTQNFFLYPDETSTLKLTMTKKEVSKE